MKDLVWLVAVVLLAVPGTAVWRLPFIAKMRQSARWAFAFAGGLLIAALLLYAYALAGIPWSRVNIAVPLIAIAVVGLRSHTAAPESGRQSVALHVVVALFLLVTTYAIADARATCGDLIYIWAPKAQGFYVARTIDTKFLSFMFYDLMHPDYPPLVPLTYDVGSVFAHRSSLWAPLFLAPVILLSIVGALRGFGGSRPAAALLMSVLSFAFVSAYLPGGADPFLLLFESVAVIALTFAPDVRDAQWIASLALAGAAFTKVEGATFAIIVTIAYVLTQRRVVRAAAMIAPAAALLATWLLFAWRHKLLDQYARAHSAIYWNQLAQVVSGVFDRASYHAFWLPWIAAAAPLFVTRPWRRAAFPLLVGAGAVAATLFFYLHNPDPAFWIATSADRILVTPLMCVAVASAAAWRTGEAA